ncbi:hypothetical protein JXA48_01040 [Candidatus Woesearchaeota archaeon]|nr:hypothetical protein [Candidatus Woesearchaeota archaeon]
MIRKYLFIIFILLLLASSSCTMPAVSPGKINRAATENFYVGNEGLVVNYLDQAPPSEMFETSDFDVQMFISNKGAFSLAENYSAKASLIYDSSKVERITDLETGYYRGSYINDGIISLFGKSYYYPSGEQNYFAIDRFRAKEVPTNFETSHLDFGLNICYPYQTTFAEAICIDSDPQKADIRVDACQAEDKKYGQGQGAPVAITAVDVQMIPRGTLVQPRFVIYVKNEGNGLVYNFNESLLDAVTIPNKGVTHVCGDMKEAKPNQMRIDAYLGEEKLDCSLPVLRAGETKIECQLTESKIPGNVANYMSSLRVTLKYFYTEVFSKEVVIKQADDNLISMIKPLGPSYCAAWKTYDQETKTCVDNCEYYGKHNSTYLDKVKKLDLPYNQQWSGLSCIYSTPDSCHDADGLCTTNSSDLCMRGTYCGWPECLQGDNNRKPFVSKHTILGTKLNPIQFTWVCNDFDDKYYVEKLCGCEEYGYYQFVDSKTNCGSLDIDNMSKIKGVLANEGFQYVVDIPANNEQKLCYAVKDRLGASSKVESADI